MIIPKEIANDIADSLEMGLKCYIHKKTLEVVTFPDEDRYPDMEEDVWQEDIDKVTKDRKEYIEIESMNSAESFRVIKEFVNSLENSHVKNRLLLAIEGRKPFANFKQQIDNSGDYREQWFAFGRERGIEWVQSQVI